MLWKVAWIFPEILQIASMDQTSPPLGISLQDPRPICTSLFSEVSFSQHPKGGSNQRSTGRWMNEEIQSVYSMEWYSALRRTEVLTYQCYKLWRQHAKWNKPGPRASVVVLPGGSGATRWQPGNHRVGTKLGSKCLLGDRGQWGKMRKFYRLVWKWLHSDVKTPRVNQLCSESGWDTKFCMMCVFQIL